MVIIFSFVATEFMDFSSDSFVEWQSLSLCQTASQCQSQSYNTDIQLSFRSRDEDNSGLLFLVKGDNGAEYIKLQVSLSTCQFRLLSLQFPCYSLHFHHVPRGNDMLLVSEIIECWIGLCI